MNYVPLQRNPDLPLETFSAGGPEGMLSGVAGGEAEGVIRMFHEQSSGERADPPKLQRFRIHKPYRETLLESGGRILRVGAVNGLAHATEVLEELKNGSRHLDFLEVMACPWGCVNGGGQPIPAPEASLRNWSRTLYDLAR